jgi:hypothetical protein
MTIFTSIRNPFRQIGHALYWLRTHTYNKYHMLDLRSSQNGYSWGWLDRSEAILFANMAILIDFIEKEKAFEGFVDWRSAEEMKAAGEEVDAYSEPCYNNHAEAKKEMLAIYNWWKKGRKEEHDALEKRYEEAYKDDKFEFEPIENGMFKLKDRPVTPEQIKARKQIWKDEESLEAKDDEMMIRLVKVRGYMWT